MSGKGKSDNNQIKNKGGRPKKVINKNQFEELCHIQCTQEEIQAVLDVQDDTLNKWCKETYGCGFSEVFRQKREGGKCSLRRKQWKLADTNASMAIFLGKNMLGQTDKQEQKIEIGSDGFIEALKGSVKETFVEGNDVIEQ